MSRVSLIELTKRYSGADRPAVDRLSLEIEAGAITVLLGPSGCGKTTTLKLIAGLLSPTGGDIAFNGQSVRHIPAEKRGAVMVFQNYLLFPYMTVGQNIGFGLKMRGEKKSVIRRRVAEMLELVRLPGLAGRRPSQLSGGQQQRVALARALVIEPEALLLDEPLSNLDAHLREEMRELLRSIQRRLGITTLFVTHDQQEAVILADRIGLLFEGRLEQVGDPASFYERPGSVRTARFFGGVNFIAGTVRGDRFSSDLGQFRLSAPQQIQSGPAVATIRPENVRLDLSAPENSLRGVITARTYRGTHTRYRVRVERTEFQVVAGAETIHTYTEGDTVSLHFPPDKLWLICPKGGGGATIT